MKNYIFSILLLVVIVIFLGGLDCTPTEQITEPQGETGTGGLILATTDGGLTWDVNIYSNLISISAVSCFSFDHNAFCVIGGPPSTIESSIYRSVNFGRDLHVKNLTLIPMDLTNTSPEGMGFAVGTSSQTPIFRTTDNGLNWQAVSGVTGHSLWAIDFGDALKGIILNEEAQDSIFLSDDGGSSWTGRPPITPDFYINAVKFTGSLNSTDAIVCGNNGKIFRTENAGVNWSEITSPVTDQNFNDVDFFDPVGIIVGDNGTILRTADGGYFWQVVASGVTNKLNKVYVNESAYYIGGEGVLLKSTDQGQTWTAIRTAPKQNYLDMFFIKNTGVVVGSTH